MRTKEQIQAEIDKLQKELEDLKSDYRSRGTYRISLSNGNLTCINDIIMLSNAINNHLRFNTEEQAKSAVDDIKHLLKLHALANHFNGEGGGKDSCVICFRGANHFVTCDSVIGVPRFTKTAAKKACEVLNAENSI